MTSALVFDVYKLVPPGDSIEFVGTLDDAWDKSYRPELNGSGSGQFTINRNSPNATTAILGDGVNNLRLIKVRVPEVSTDPIGCFFLETGDFTLISSDEEGGEDLRFGGAGGLSYWNRAIWLATTYTLPWWPNCLTAGPTTGAKGAVVVQAGNDYRAYTLDGSTPPKITGFTEFRTPGFCASFDTRRTYVWPGANPDGSNSKRFLVHLLDGPQTGIYFHPHQEGVTEYLASKATGTGTRSTVKLTDVGASPGAVLKYLWDEAQSVDRPQLPIPLMTVDFDATVDSNGDPWTTTDALAGMNASIGDNYLSTVGGLLGTGVIDVVMGPDLDMHAYNTPYGRDLTGAFGVGNVRFQRGVNVAEQLKRTFADRQVGTFAQVSGPDDTFGQASLPDASSRIAREVAVNADSVDDTTLAAVGLAALNLRLLRGESLEFPIVVGDDEMTGRYLPGPDGTDGHFWVGDLVTVDTGAPAPDFDEADARVIALALEEDPAGGLVVKVNVKVGPLADVGSLGQDTPESISIGDTLGECGCPPFHAPDAHWYTGEFTFYEDGGGGAEGAAFDQVGGSTQSTTNPDGATFLPDTTYHYAVEMIVPDPADYSPGFWLNIAGGGTVGAIWVDLPAGPGNISISGSFTTGSGVFTTPRHMHASVAGTHGSTAIVHVTFWVDPDGWDGSGAPLPEYGQEVVHDTVVETADGSTTVFTLVLGALVGYRAGSLVIEENGVDVTPYVTELDLVAGTFEFDNAPPTGTEIVVRRYQSALVAA